VIEDPAQFYARPSASDTEGEPFTERCQYMFRSNPIPSVGNTDQFNNGGGLSYFPNVFQAPATRPPTRRASTRSRVSPGWAT
jgi:hypothetical protein